MSKALVPDCELENLTGRNVAFGHVTYYGRYCTRDAMAKIPLNLSQWAWANLKIDWICCYSCDLRLICASMQATRLRRNSEESLFNSYLLQLPTLATWPPGHLATCPAARVLSP
jgi:hypothetical protein